VQSARPIAKNLLKWFGTHARDLPWRRTSDPYAIWISEVMLQQTQVKTVIPYWERWMKRLPNVHALARASEHHVLKLWEGLGYYSRARNLQQAAKLIVTDYDGQLPSEFDAVLDLPGIGRYTAGAICSMAFNQPHAVVDGNVIRVLTRLFAIRGNPKERRTNDKLWSLATNLVTAAQRIDADRGCSHLNQSLMELGATICLPQNPRCEDCPVRKICVARRTEQTNRFPELPHRGSAIKRHVAAFVLERDGRYLVRQRPAGVNHGLWEFPNIEVTSSLTLSELARKHLGLDLSRAQKLSTIRHTITHNHITMEVFRCRPPREDLVAGKWCTRSQLERLPFPSAHREVVDQIAATNGQPLA
jgi:A/G-specific adenine glycosylase